MRTPDCIACRKALKNLDLRGNQPSNGLEFLTYGHYGSTFFDPMNGTRLAINVCDDCLRKAEERQDILLVVPEHIETWKYETLTKKD